MFATNPCFRRLIMILEHLTDCAKNIIGFVQLKLQFFSMQNDFNRHTENNSDLNYKQAFQNHSTT